MHLANVDVDYRGIRHEGDRNRRGRIHWLGRLSASYRLDGLVGRQFRQANLRRQSRFARRHCRKPALPVRARLTSPTAPPCARLVRRGAPGCGSEPRGRIPRRPLDRLPPATSFTPISTAPLSFWRKRGAISTALSAKPKRRHSASTMSRPTKCSASSDRPASSPRQRPTIHPRLIRRARPPPITWFAPGAAPTDCRCCSPIAPTITGRINSPRSSCR